jgi:polysaccharide biosynthesis transport protein
VEDKGNLSVGPALDRTEGFHSAAQDLSLEELFRKLRRRVWLILAIVAAAAVLAAVVSVLLPTRYTATAKVMVADRAPAGPDLTAAAQGMPPDLAFMSSQVQVIASRNLATTVIDKLGLESDPEFNEELRPKSLFRRATDELPIQVARQWLGIAPPDANTELAKQLQRESVIDAFLQNLDAEVVETSRVIDVTFTAEDREKAARIANALADAYINQHLENEYQSIRRTMSWLNDRVEALRREVKTADDAVERFRAQRGLLRGTRGETLNEQQVSELSSQLVLARSRRAESEARLSQVRGLARSGGTSSLAEVVNSPLIGTLIAQEAEVKRKIAQYSKEYGERHPLPINAKAELQDLQTKIGVEVGRVVQSLQNEVVVAAAREQSLQRSLEQFGVRLSKSNADEVTLRALEREAEAARSTLETFMQQSHQLNAQDSLRAQQADVTLISSAPVPVDASFPKRKLMVALAIVVSGLIAVVVVLIVEQLDAGFRSAEQIQQAFGVPVLGSLPDVGRRRSGGPSAARHVLQHPTSAFAEAVRRVHTRLLQERGVRTVQITSAEPGEGKTTLSLSLAQVDARLGRRVLLIDTDFRKSDVASLIGLRSSPGLFDILSGRARFQDVVQTDESGAHVVVAGSFAVQTSEMLVLRDLAPFLAEVGPQYDSIIVDSPPVISLVDASIVAGQVDRTLLVVRWARTRRSVVGHALSEIAAAGGTLGGVVLSVVDVKRHALYAFGDSGQYHGRYRKYYDVA